jgi:large subunit ribosomal protein L24
MPHVRKGDMVIVTSGAYKGKRGKILKIVGDRVIVEKVAMIKRHQKPTQKTPQGGIIDKEGTIHISNVALFDDKLGSGTRTRSVVEGDGKVRIGVKSGTKFPNTGMV